MIKLIAVEDCREFQNEFKNGTTYVWPALVNLNFLSCKSFSSIDKNKEPTGLNLRSANHLCCSALIEGTVNYVNNVVVLHK